MIEDALSDELEALGAIFGPDDEAIRFAMTASGLRFSVKLDMAEDAGPLGLERSELALAAELVEGYPSRVCPGAKVRCSWADEASLAAVEKALRGMFEPGVPVLYTWCEWLRSAGWRLLVPSAASLASVRYCLVCFDSSASDMLDISDACGHTCCRGCLTAFCEMHVREGSVQQLHCPSPKCTEAVPVRLVRELCGAEAAERYDALLLGKALAGMAQTCPECATVCLRHESVDGLAQCPCCFHAFCTECRAGYHPGSPCLATEQRLAKLRAQLNVANGKVEAQEAKESDAVTRLTQASRNKTNKKKDKDKREQDMTLTERMEKAMAPLTRRCAGNNAPTRDASRAAQRAIQQEIDTLNLIKRIGAKQCPKCRMFAEKISGCNKVHCECGASFCFRCGKDISKVGYDHFEGEECALFTEDNNNRARPRYADRAPERRGPDWSACVSCKTPNQVMAGNNHLKCLSCATQYCALCRKPFRSAKEHFNGPGRCPQHGH